jgi:hypothetical protein
MTIVWPSMLCFNTPCPTMHCHPLALVNIPYPTTPFPTMSLPHHALPCHGSGMPCLPAHALRLKHSINTLGFSSLPITTIIPFNRKPSLGCEPFRASSHIVPKALHYTSRSPSPPLKTQTNEQDQREPMPQAKDLLFFTEELSRGEGGVYTRRSVYRSPKGCLDGEEVQCTQKS